MKDGTSATPSTDQESPRIPVLQMPSRRGQRRFTLLLGGAVVVLILVQALSSRPLPPPSHRTATAAVAGYLEGIEHSHLEEIREYLAPDQRASAAALLRAFTTQRAYITAPQVGYSDVGKRTAEVTISAEVCSAHAGGRIYSCNSVGRAPLGLPDQLSCVKVDGDWYVTTLFKPR